MKVFINTNVILEYLWQGVIDISVSRWREGTSQAALCCLL